MKTNEAPKTEARTHDLQGRPYAKMSDLKVGDIIQVDGDFTCIPANAKRTVRLLHGELYLDYSCGAHLLCGQEEDDCDTLIGIYKCSPTEAAPSEELKK